MHYGTCEDEKIGSALASLGVFASLWVANPRKGRLRDAEAAARQSGNEATGEEGRVEGQRLIPVAERQFVQGPEMR